MHNDGKRNYIQTLFSFDVFSILCEIAANQLRKSDAIFRLIDVPLRVCREREMQACRIVTGGSFIITT